MTLEDEFKIRNNALVAACRRLARAVMATDCELKISVAALLVNAAQTLAGYTSWAEKASAARELRDLLNKESFAERPAPDGYPWWYTDLCTLMEHSTIYEEHCYTALRKAGSRDAF